MVRFKVFDVVVNVQGTSRRIAKIEFAKYGSVYVYFPGFANSSGILCRATLRGGIAATTLDLKENGRVTSHLVKYAHHPDGRAHFSQTGKVKTDIRRQSIPLADQRGHLFTIQVQKFESFPPLLKPRQAQLTFNLAGETTAFKLTGWRYKMSELRYPPGATPSATPKGIQTHDGTIRQGLFVAPPEGAPFDDVTLFVAAEEIPWLSEDRAEHLIFIGGFDSTETALNHSVDTEFLAFAYPCADAGQLMHTIGSIDLSSPDA